MYSVFKPHASDVYSINPPATTPRRFDPKAWDIFTVFLNEVAKIMAAKKIGRLIKKLETTSCSKTFPVRRLLTGVT